MDSENSLQEKIETTRDLVQRGEFSKASQLLNEIENLAKETNKIIKCDVLCQKGKIAWRQGDNKQAKKYLSDALKIGKEIDYKYGQAFAINILGHLALYSPDERPESLELYQKGLKLSQEMEDFKGIGISYHNIAMFYHEVGDYGKAQHYYNEALSAREQAGDSVGIGWTQTNLGELYRALGDVNQAINAYEQARHLFEVGNDVTGRSLATQNLGILYWGLGKSKKSESLLLESLSSWNELKIKNKTVVENLAILAEIHASSGQISIAHDFLRDAESIVEAIGIPQARMYFLFAKGIVSRKEGNNANAKDFFTACLDVARTNNFFLYSILSLLQLTEMYLIQYRLTLEEVDLEQARTKLIETAKLAQQKGMQGVILETKIIQGILESTQMNYLKSIELLRKAVEDASRWNFLKLKESAESHLIKIQKMHKKAKEAFKPTDPSNQIQEVIDYVAKYQQLLKGLKN